MPLQTIFSLNIVEEKTLNTKMTLLFQFQKMMSYFFELNVQVLITQTLIL